jgi:hypothetical protein
MAQMCHTHGDRPAFVPYEVGHGRYSDQAMAATATESVHTDGTVLIITEHSVPRSIGTRPEGWEVQQPPNAKSADELERFETVILVGPLADAVLARQLAGVAQIAATKGTVVVYLVGAGASDTDGEVMDLLFGARRTSRGGRSNVRARVAAFADYFTVFGTTGAVLSDAEVEETVTVLGEVEFADRENLPAAVWVRTENGATCYLPFSADLGDLTPVIAAVLDALKTYKTSRPDEFPEYLAGLELPGEAKLRESIAATQDRLAALEDEAAALDGWKRLVGELSGSDFEQLVIGALNFVLEGSGCRAEDRHETHSEDFWLIRDGTDFALCEAKGTGSHVRRENVHQVDGHRERVGKGFNEIPGLLIVNVRRSHGLDQKRQPPSRDVQSYAARVNVVVMRAWDLYGLVERRLQGDNAGRDALIDALDSGGGWLEVGQQVALHTGR